MSTTKRIPTNIHTFRTGAFSIELKEIPGAWSLGGQGPKGALRPSTSNLQPTAITQMVDELFTNNHLQGLTREQVLEEFADPWRRVVLRQQLAEENRQEELAEGQQPPKTKRQLQEEEVRQAKALGEPGGEDVQD